MTRTSKSNRRIKGGKAGIKTKLEKNLLHFSDNSSQEVSFLFSSAIGLSGTMVSVTYTLKKSSDVRFMSLSIGNVHIDLHSDMDEEDSNVFNTRDGKTYTCLKEANGIKVFATADGKTGGSWNLTISINGNPLTDNPIKAAADTMGHLDHNQFHR